MSDHQKQKNKEWLRRYIPAEILGTITALTAAMIAFGVSGSYITAAAAGWLGEAVGFFGYFISMELIAANTEYRSFPPFKKFIRAAKRSSTNLLIEFLPAELIDNFLIRPFLLYLGPLLIHPYVLGFLAGKFSADIVFYLFAIVGYETRKKWFSR